MIRRSRRALRRWGLPLVGWLSAIMYLIVAGGVPISIPGASTKDTSVPFPCIDRACGCGSAAACWAGCCCHTPAERLAWARQHGVTPPPTLIVLVDQAAVVAKSGSCCSGKAVKSCCAVKKSDCCTNRGHADAPKHVAADTTLPTAPTTAPDGEQPEQPAEADTVIGFQALACQGIGADWLAGFVALPPVVVEGPYQPAPVGIAATIAPTFFSAAFPPPVPPPRPAVS